MAVAVCSLLVIAEVRDEVAGGDVGDEGFVHDVMTDHCVSNMTYDIRHETAVPQAYVQPVMTATHTHTSTCQSALSRVSTPA